MKQIKARVKTGPSASESEYLPKGTRKWLSYSDMTKYLLENVYAKKAGECDDLLEMLWRKQRYADTEEEELTIPQLRDSVRELFSFFRWHSSIDGSYSWYVRSSCEVAEYVYTKDPIVTASALFIDVEGVSTSLEDLMSMKYLELAQKKDLDFLFTPSEDGEEKKSTIPTLSEYWEKLVKPIWERDSWFRLKEQPVTLSGDTDTPCFTYFNPDVLKPGKHTAWDDWLIRMPEYARPIFRAWVFSIFDPQNEGRQCVWLYDKGYSGKTSVTKALADFLGSNSTASISQKSLSNQFAYSTIYGKRFVVYGDNKNSKLLHTGVVHSVLGGDIVQVERKQKDSFSAVVHAKLMVASNVLPEVDLAARNETSRIIFVPLEDPPKEIMAKFCATDKNGGILRYPDGSPKFIGGSLKKELIREMEHFLYTCKQDYIELCPNRADIPLPDDMFESLRDKCPSPEHLSAERFAEENLEIGADLECSQAELYDAYQKYAKSKGKHNSSLDYAHTKNFLKVTYGIESTRKGNRRIVTGCTVKDDFQGII